MISPVGVFDIGRDIEYLFGVRLDCTILMFHATWNIEIDYPICRPQDGAKC